MSSKSILEERLKSLTIAVGVKRKTIQLCKGVANGKIVSHHNSNSTHSKQTLFKFTTH